jgi:lysophospholipase L1-like esterase
MKSIIILTLTFIISILFSCTKSQFDEYETSHGTADFTNYISVGNSFTQGLQDGGLHNEHGQQDNSYPAIIAGQMETNFLQPIVSGTGSGYMHLEYRDGEIVVIKNYDPDISNNDPAAIDYDASFTNWGDTTVKYNNLGIGGINVRNVVNMTPAEYIYLGGGATPPLAWNGVNGEPISPYGRFINWGTLSNKIEYIVNVKKSNATFFTNWLGINDVMGWAKEGGDDLDGFSVLTDPLEFKEKYDTLLSVFQEMGANGICATIHDISNSPLFTTITLEVLGKDIWIKEGADTTIIRKAVPDDLILLSAKDLIGDGVGLVENNPLPHQQVLDRDEVVIVRNYTNQYNNQIRISAAAHGYPVVDMYAFMSSLNSGVTFDGIDLSTKYIEGGAFSLDGLHPNTRGYAMIANEFIKAINSNYNSTLQTVPVGNYNGIIFP